MPPPPSLNACLLAAAAIYLDAQPVAYGPLWSARCSTRSRPRIELQVYDVFAMVFLDRPGSYYRLDQRARALRGDCTPDLIIAQLRIYHRLMGSAHADNTEPFLTNTQLKEWWLMPRHTRTALDQQLAADPTTPSYDYSYVAFLRHFIPQQRDRDHTHRFFNSLARYIPLLLSTDVELRRCPALSSSALAYGVFARRRLTAGKWFRPLKALRGEVVPITEQEQQALASVGADFSLLELDDQGLRRLRLPGQQGGRKRQKVSNGGQACVVAGGMAFVNHACHEHANMWPAVWEKGVEADVGAGQWQVATTKRVVQAGEELFLFYGRPDAEEKDMLPCTVCAQRRG